MKAMWTDQEQAQVFERLQGETTRAFLNAFAYIGEQFINNARRRGTYTDRTGNLRSSVGYVILVDHRIANQRFEGTSQGKEESRALVNRLRTELPGLVLVCMAGMSYAAYVEARGYDVITGSTPTDNEIGNQLKTLCRAYLK